MRTTSQIQLPVFFLILSFLILGKMKALLMDGILLSILLFHLHHQKLRMLSIGLGPCLLMPLRNDLLLLNSSTSVSYHLDTSNSWQVATCIALIILLDGKQDWHKNLEIVTETQTYYIFITKAERLFKAGEAFQSCLGVHSISSYVCFIHTCTYTCNLKI